MWYVEMYRSNYTIFSIFVLQAIDYNTNMELLCRAACFPMVHHDAGSCRQSLFWYSMSTQSYISAEELKKHLVRV